MKVERELGLERRPLLKKLRLYAVMHI